MGVGGIGTAVGLLGAVGAVGALRQRQEAQRARSGLVAALGADTELEDPPGDRLHARLTAWRPRGPAAGSRRAVQGAWVLPSTLVGALVALLGGRVPRWEPDHRCWVAAPVGGPTAAALRAVGATAATIGQVVVSRRAPLGARLLAHEAHHVRQQEQLGLLFGPAYALAQARWGYRANPFEVAARRAAAAAPAEGPGGRAR